MNTRLIQHSIRAVGRYKLRTAFIMLGTIIGSAALTFVVSVGKGAERKIMTTMNQIFGGSAVLIMAGGTNIMGGPNANAARLTIDDIEAVAGAVPDVELWDVQQTMPSDTSIRSGDATATARVLGQSERSERVWQRTVSRGTYFDAAAVRSSERVALVGENTALKLFGTADPLDREIQIGNVPFRIIGVLERFGTDVHGMDRDAEIVVPISTLQRRLLNVDTIMAAKLLVKNPAQVPGATAELTRLLRERHAIAKGRPDDFHLMSTVAVQKMIGKVKRVLDLYLPMGAGIAMLVAAIVAATLMLSSVSERIGEIGLRRAVGARIEDVQLQFIVETATTIVGGGILGIVLGLFAARYFALRFQLGGIFTWQVVLLGIVVSTVTGILAGVLPARRAARLDPAVALR